MHDTVPHLLPLVKSRNVRQCQYSYRKTPVLPRWYWSFPMVVLGLLCRLLSDLLILACGIRGARGLSCGGRTCSARKCRRNGGGRRFAGCWGLMFAAGRTPPSGASGWRSWWWCGLLFDITQYRYTVITNRWEKAIQCFARQACFCFISSFLVLLASVFILFRYLCSEKWWKTVSNL